MALAVKTFVVFQFLFRRSAEALTLVATFHCLAHAQDFFFCLPRFVFVLVVADLIHKRTVTIGAVDLNFV